MDAIAQRADARDPGLRQFLLLIWPYVRTPTLAYVTDALASYPDRWCGNARPYCGRLRLSEVDGDVIIRRVELISTFWLMGRCGLSEPQIDSCLTKKKAQGLNRMRKKAVTCDWGLRRVEFVVIF